MSVIRQFADTFPPSYTQAELTDLSEAVISYQSKKKIQFLNASQVLVLSIFNKIILDTEDLNLQNTIDS